MLVFTITAICFDWGKKRPRNLGQLGGLLLIWFTLTPNLQLTAAQSPSLVPSRPQGTYSTNEALDDGLPVRRPAPSTRDFDSPSHASRAFVAATTMQGNPADRASANSAGLSGANGVASITGDSLSVDETYSTANRPTEEIPQTHTSMPQDGLRPSPVSPSVMQGLQRPSEDLGDDTGPVISAQSFAPPNVGQKEPDFAGDSQRRLSAASTSTQQPNRSQFEANSFPQNPGTESGTESGPGGPQGSSRPLGFGSPPPRNDESQFSANLGRREMSPQKFAEPPNPQDSNPRRSSRAFQPQAAGNAAPYYPNSATDGGRGAAPIERIRVAGEPLKTISEPSEATEPAIDGSEPAVDRNLAAAPLSLRPAVPGAQTQSTSFGDQAGASGIQFSSQFQTQPQPQTQPQSQISPQPSYTPMSDTQVTPASYAAQNPSPSVPDFPASNSNADTSRGLPASGADLDARRGADTELAKRLIEAYTVAANNGTAQGQPVTLAQMLAQPLTTEQRNAMVQQYWETFFDWAILVNERDYQQWLNKIPGSSPADENMLAATRMMAQNNILAAEIQLGKSQAQLSQFIPNRTAASPPPLPVDLPMIEKFNTNYEQYKSRGMLPANLVGIDQMLPRTLELIGNRAQAVELAKQGADQTLAGLSQRQTTMSAVVTSSRQWKDARRDLLASIVNYNQAADDYALTMMRGYRPPDYLAAKLLGKRNALRNSPQGQQLQGAQRPPTNVASLPSTMQQNPMRPNAGANPGEARSVMQPPNSMTSPPNGLPAQGFRGSNASAPTNGAPSGGGTGSQFELGREGVMQPQNRGFGGRPAPTNQPSGSSSGSSVGSPFAPR